jgi:hypothetical protein
MSTIASLLVKLGLDAREFQAGAKGAESTAKGLGGALSGLGGAAKTIGLGIVGLAGGAVAGLGAVLGTSLNAAREAEQISAQLDNVIKATGGVAGVTKTSVDALSAALSTVTPIEDDVITGAQAMLLTFKEIGRDNFPRATEAVLDMATAMNRGGTPSAEQLQSAAIQLGKALNDPLTGMTALSKVGVTFSGEQKELIKTMAQAGNVAGAQRMILRELESEFGGAARAAGKTFSGQLEILENQLGNVQEEIGMALIPVLGGLATALGPGLIAGAQAGAAWLTGTLIPAIADVANWVTANWPLIQATAAQVWGQVQSVVGQAVAFIQGLLARSSQATTTWGAAWQSVQTLIATILPPIQSLVQSVVGAITTFLAAHGAEIQATFGRAWSTAGAIVLAAIQVIQATVVPILGEIGRFIATHGAEIQMILGNSWTFISTTITTALNTILGVVRTVLALVRGDWVGAFTEMQAVGQGLATWAQTTFIAALSTLNVLSGGKLQELYTWFVNKFGQIRDFLAGFDLKDVGEAIINSVREGVIASAQGLVAAVVGAINGAIAAAKAAIAGLAGGLPGGVTVPGFALGTMFAPGGLAMVGERGPELVQLPRGSRVYPNRELRGAGGVTSNYQFSVTVNAPGGQPAAVAGAVEDGVRRAMRAVGVR